MEKRERERKKVIQIGWAPELLKKIERLSREDGVDRSSFIRLATVDYIKRRGDNGKRIPENN